MLEVVERFPGIGTIENYQALSPGERALYDQYTLIKLEAEAKASPAINFLFGRKK